MSNTKRDKQATCCNCMVKLRHFIMGGFLAFCVVHKKNKKPNNNNLILFFT